MDFLSYFGKYILVDIHKQYIRLLYRGMTELSQKFGLKVMFQSMFRPLFGLPGISARITGFVFRVIIILISLILLTIGLGLGLSVYPVLFYLLWLGITRNFLLVVLLCLLVVASKFYDYYTKPRIKLREVKTFEGLFNAAKLDDRRFINSFSTSDYQNLIVLMRNNKEILRFIERCELPVNETFDFIDRKISGVNKSSYFERLLELEKITTNNYLTGRIFFCCLLTSINEADLFLAKYRFSIDELNSSLRYSDYLEYRSPYIWESDYVLSPGGGIDKGWAVGYSSVLNKYSTDFSKLAIKGLMPKLIGREDVRTDIISILSKPSRNNVMLIGDAGCGKTTFIKGLAREVAIGTEIPSLKYKRFVSLDIGGLTSGSIGEINQKMSKMLKEISDAGNIILFIDEVHNLSSTLNADPNAVAVFSTLEPYLSSGKFQCIGATSRKNYAKYIAPNESFSRAFDVVELRETTFQETVLIMEDVAKQIESTGNIAITYPAISDAINLSKRLIHTSVYPDKSVELLNQAVSRVRNSGNSVVNRQLISQIVSKVTNVPVDQIQKDEREVLSNLKNVLHKRVIGQDLAIDAIVKAIKRGRVGVRDENKPIASFLFAGPTGVGKTETAKALAEAYYGSENQMVRVDMSEYQTPSSVTRLMGDENGNIGVLTSQVRAKPNSLILLDEIEKAHPNIHNLFLQVLDDGRLSDAYGSVIDFTNSVIIMTSNVGSKMIVDVIDNNSIENIPTDIGLTALKEFFPPEFLNRFTDIVSFLPLTKAQIFEITKIKLSSVSKKMSNKKIKIIFSENVLQQIASLGYSKDWGVRPLNRVIEDKIETLLADKIINEEIKPGDTYELKSIS